MSDVVAEMFVTMTVISDQTVSSSHPYSSQIVLTDGIYIRSRLFYWQSLEIYAAYKQ
jgi:hypothetical protein